jgi:hypothetical protein
MEQGQNGGPALTNVEMTPAMIEAGVIVLRESGRLEFEGTDDPLLVREILDAVLSQAQSQGLQAG